MKKLVKVESNGNLTSFVGSDKEWALSQGFCEMEVEQGYDNNFYFANNLPSPPIPSYDELRKNEYPDITEYLDAQVKINSNDETLKTEGNKQLAQYYADCLTIKNKYPKN